MKNFVIIVFGLLIITSCKKSNEKILIGSWKVEKVEFSEDGIIFIEDVDNCVSDDVWTFTKDNELEVNQGLLCAGSPAVETAWYLKDEDNTIVYTYDVFVGEYYSTIVQLTKETLVTEHLTIPSNENSTKVRTTFSKY